MSQLLPSNPKTSFLFGLFVALLVLTFFFGRQTKQSEVIVQPLNDEKFKHLENLIKDKKDFAERKKAGNSVIIKT